MRVEEAANVYAPIIPKKEIKFKTGKLNFFTIKRPKDYRRDLINILNNNKVFEIWFAKFPNLIGSLVDTFVKINKIKDILYT